MTENKSLNKIIDHIQLAMFGWAGARGAPLEALGHGIIMADGGDHVEIGSLFGASAIMAAIVQKEWDLDGHVYCIDPMVFEEQEPFITRNKHRPKTDTMLLTHQADVFTDNIKRFKVEDRVTLVRARSRPWPLKHEFTSCFIDGWHYGDTPLADAKKMTEIVTKVIIIDDIVEPYPAVYEGFQYIVAHDDWILFLKDQRAALFHKRDPNVVPWEERVGYANRK